MTGVFAAMLATITIILVVYWLRLRVWIHRFYSPATFLLLPAMLALLLFIAGRSAGELEGAGDEQQQREHRWQQ